MQSIILRNVSKAFGSVRAVRPMRLGRFRWVAFGLVAFYLLLSLVLPAIILVQTSLLKLQGLPSLLLQSSTERCPS